MIKKCVPVFLIIITFCIGCVSRQTIKSADTDGTKKNQIVFSGGDGGSYETAIIISKSKETIKPKDMVAAEYDYISVLYGKKDKDWKVEEQSRVKENEKPYDMVRVKIISNEKMHFFFFDISASAVKQKTQVKED